MALVMRATLEAPSAAMATVVMATAATEMMPAEVTHQSARIVGSKRRAAGGLFDFLSEGLISLFNFVSGPYGIFTIVLDCLDCTQIL